MANENTPVHLNPKSMMNKVRIDDKMAKILSGGDPIQRRDDFVDALYSNFKENVDVPTTITLEEFKRYEPLYSSEERKRYENHQMSKEEEEVFKNLSEEYFHRVDTQKPIYIVDENTGETAILPPIFMRINNLVEKGNEAIDIFHNAFVKDDGVKGSASALHRDKATANLASLIAGSQDTDTIAEQAHEFDILAHKLFKENLGKNLYPAGFISDEETDNVKTENTSVSIEKEEEHDLLEFKLDDDE